MKFKTKTLDNYYTLKKLLWFKIMVLYGWCEGKIRSIKLTKQKPF